MGTKPIRTAIRFATAGALIPALLWGVIKSQDYGFVGGPVGETLDRWAFELLVMLAPFFYHTVAFIQDMNLVTAYTIAFATNVVLYAVIGGLATRLRPSPLAYYFLVGLMVASMLICADSWFLYRWLSREELHLPLTLGDFDLRYFVVTATVVIAFFIVDARKGGSRYSGYSGTDHE